MTSLKGIVAAFAASAAIMTTGSAALAGALEYNPIRDLLSYFGGLAEFQSDRSLTRLCDATAAKISADPQWIENEKGGEGMLTVYFCNAAGHKDFATIPYNHPSDEAAKDKTPEQIAGGVYIAVDEQLEPLCEKHREDKARPAYVSTLCNAAGYGGYQKPCERKGAHCG